MLDSVTDSTHFYCSDASDDSQRERLIESKEEMRTPEDTLEALKDLHNLYSRFAHRLIVEYAAGDKSVKYARDLAEDAEKVIFLFHRAVQRQTLSNTVIKKERAPSLTLEKGAAVCPGGHSDRAAPASVCQRGPWCVRVWVSVTPGYALGYASGKQPAPRGRCRGGGWWRAPGLRRERACRVLL